MSGESIRHTGSSSYTTKILGSYTGIDLCPDGISKGRLLAKGLIVRSAAQSSLEAHVHWGELEEIIMGVPIDGWGRRRVGGV